MAKLQHFLYHSLYMILVSCVSCCSAWQWTEAGNTLKVLFRRTPFYAAEAYKFSVYKALNGFLHSINHQYRGSVARNIPNFVPIHIWGVWDSNPLPAH